MFKKRLNILILVLIVITLFSAVILTPIFIFKKNIFTSDTRSRKTFTKEINSNEIKNLSINTDVANLHIKKHNKENFYIEYYAYKNSKFSVEENSLTELKIETLSKQNNSQNVYMKVYCPVSFKGNLKVKNDVGSIEIDGNYQNLNTVNNVGTMSVKGNYTSVVLQSDLGDISGDFSADSFDISGNTGDIDIKLLKISEGIYNIKSDMGDISLTLPKDPDINLTANTKIGDIHVNKGFIKSLSSYNIKNSNNELIIKNKKGKANININSNSSGDITIK